MISSVSKSVEQLHFSVIYYLSIYKKNPRYSYLEIKKSDFEFLYWPSRLASSHNNLVFYMTHMIGECHNFSCLLLVSYNSLFYHKKLVYFIFTKVSRSMVIKLYTILILTLCATISLPRGKRASFISKLNVKRPSDLGLSSSLVIMTSRS